MVWSGVGPRSLVCWVLIPSGSAFVFRFQDKFVWLKNLEQHVMQRIFSSFNARRWQLALGETKRKPRDNTTQHKTRSSNLS